MSSSKSKAAFKFDVGEFINLTLAKRGRVYMWTFTFVNYHSPDQAQSCWHGFLDALRKHTGSMDGLKVIEPHPGGHGAHYHLLLNQRLPMVWLRKLGKPWGFGFMWVEKVTFGKLKGLADYLCKYLSKSMGSGWENVRRWAAFGKWERTKVADVVLECCANRVVSAFRLWHGIRGRMKFYHMIVLRHTSNLWGDVYEWPMEELQRCRDLIGAWWDEEKKRLTCVPVCASLCGMKKKSV